MDDPDDDERLYAEKLVRKKGKCNYYFEHADTFLLMKPKARHGKCLGAEVVAPPTKDLLKNDDSTNTRTSFLDYNLDIWFHISLHIRPEDVGGFASLCHQTNSLVKSKQFWLNLYRIYCLNAIAKTHLKWTLHLPAELQYDSVKDCDINLMRVRVIKALFYCHQPFVNRVKRGYKIDCLIGCTFDTHWFDSIDCTWKLYYKFYNRPHKKEIEDPLDKWLVKDDWESLANEKSTEITNNFDTINEGVYLLILFSKHFAPLPDCIEQCLGTCKLRLINSRMLLNSNMRSTDIELDFVNTLNKTIVTVKHLNISKHTVIPWWHPQFKTHISL